MKERKRMDEETKNSENEIRNEQPAENDVPAEYSEPETVEPAEDSIPAIAVQPEPIPVVKPHPVPGLYDSAVTVYVPYQPEGPTVTQLERAAKEAQAELKKQRRKDRKRLREWKKSARGKAKNLLYEIHNTDTPEQKSVLKSRYKTERRAWKKSIRELDESEKLLQKKAFKAFRKRLYRTRRNIAWAAVFAVLLGLGWTTAPFAETSRELLTMRYTADEAALELACAEGASVAERISDEGIVLLKNENSLLPLENKKINVFGADCYYIQYGGTKGGVSLFEGLERAGIAYNSDLHTMYVLAGVGENRSGILPKVEALVSGNEPNRESGTDYLTDELIESARKYSDQALVVLGSSGAEGEDADLHGLSLSDGRRALLRKLDENFEHIIVVLNTDNPQDLEEIDSFEKVDAILRMGTPGPYGCVSLGKILSGELTPSGRLTDTWAYDMLSAPAAVNFTKEENRYRYSGSGENYIQFEEGIYVGYRYYETRYADDAAGYEKAVRFPFGYGLSYTDFSWETVSFRTTPDTVIWKVRVRNTGNFAGKDVVQLYYSAPYSEDGPEKSGAVLAAYAKTDLLQPEEEQVLTLRFSIREMASFDTEEEAYVLDSGTYRIRLCRNVHDCVETKEYAAEETVVFRTDSATDAEISDRFEFADGGLTWLSRSDWTGTYPKGIANDPGIKNLKANEKAYRNPAPSAGTPAEKGANNGIKLADLKGAAYDDEQWQLFLDQFTEDELIRLFSNAGWHTEAVRRLGIPEIRMLGNSTGLKPYRTEIEAGSYPSETVTASTWNDRLAQEYGAACAGEAAAYGVKIWLAPNAGIHRTPFGGNHGSTWSEDPLLSGKMTAAAVKGAQSKGVAAVVTGFVTDSSTFDENRVVYTWMNEQALRELYLRPFEIAVKEGNAHGIMSAAAHIGYQWCGACGELLQEILRTEWGFDGFVISDTADHRFMRAGLACRNGNDLMLETGRLASERQIRRAYRNDPAGITESLRDCAHHYCYTIVNATDLF